jgi:curli biogenesis system outer membrane secretion channel CsgG
MKTAVKTAAIACACLAIAGCQTTNSTSKGAMETATPKSPPVRTITGFSDALSCMDDLFAKHNVRGLTLTAQDIPDQTQRVFSGTKDMLISALSRMSTKSGAFRFVAYGSDLADIVDLQGAHKGSSSFVTPDFFMRGSISQLDEGVQQKSGGVGVNTPVFNFGAQGRQLVSVVGMDLNMGCVKNLQIIPGLTSSNSVAVVAQGGGANVGGVLNAQSISPIGINLDFSVDQNEGTHQAVRTLIELGAIELMGKLTGVPYKSCLTPEAKAALQSVSVPEMLPCNVAANGSSTSVAEAQPEPAPAPQPQPAAAPAPQPVAQPAAAPAAMAASDFVLTSDRGDNPSYNTGESITLQVQSAQDTYLHCFYQQANNTVVKVFPNRFRQSAVIRGGAVVAIPDGQMPFRLKFDQPSSQEAFSCIASAEDLSQVLPLEIVDRDLEPIPVNSLDDITAVFEEVTQGNYIQRDIVIQVH